MQQTQPHLQYGNPTIPPGPGPKRRTHEEMEMSMGQLGHDEGLSGMPQGIGGYRTEHPQYHTHPLPDTGQISKRLKHGDSADSSMVSQNTISVVGQPGMPPPAMKPRGPKLKFTPEDDQLLVDLKENKSLTWKQIAEFFPGRSSGTLQVRYCTKLKAKTTQWTDETVSLSSPT
jgi:Myb-like DNA-binding domain